MSLAAGVYRATPDVLGDGRAGEILLDPAHRVQIVESGDPIGFEALTVSTTAVGLTATDGATQAEITVELADVRVRSDGVDPTATVGHLILDGAVISLSSAKDIAAFRAIRDASTNVTLSISYLL